MSFCPRCNSSAPGGQFVTCPGCNGEIIDFNAGIDLPGNIKISEDKEEMKILYYWFSGKSFIYLFFCILWNTGIITASREFFIYLSLTEGLSFHNNIIMLLLIVTVIISLFFIFITLMTFINITIICIRDKKISISYKPLPWFGSLNSEVIEKIYSKEEKEMRSSEKVPAPSTVFYSVNALLSGGKRIKIISPLPLAEQALFIEYRINKRLV